MRLVLALLAAVLLAALPAPAAAFESTDPAPAAAAPSAPAPATELAATAPAQGETVRESARAESLTRELREERQIAQRGSFWWLVGVIVVAGVLLAVLLD
ncbi:MAG TPA: hypothetical protein VHG51_11885 [Longimicrobiaceae bacterium]|nr:hypothetical protein [Longimicrobiaceae bacterium]